MKNNLIWIDLEMTGLNPEIDRIIEIVAVATDANLNVLGHSDTIVINQPSSLIDNMDEWNTNQHGGSGLIDLVKQSTVTEKQAMDRVLSFVSGYVNKGDTPLCGNSISHDRKFLKRYMPDLDDYFHYRNIDVSSVNELAKLWNPLILSKLKKDSNHRALDDILQSIEELSLYKDSFFKVK